MEEETGRRKQGAGGEMGEKRGLFLLGEDLAEKAVSTEASVKRGSHAHVQGKSVPSRGERPVQRL